MTYNIQPLNKVEKDCNKLFYTSKCRVTLTDEFEDNISFSEGSHSDLQKECYIRKKNFKF